MHQPYLPSGQPTAPLRPSAPAPVLTAVKLMYAGAAVSVAGLIIGLALIIVDIDVAARGQFLGHSLAAQKPLVITVWMVFGLVVIALWLWMARANGQGRTWARIVSTVLFGLATLQLPGGFTKPVSHAGFVAAWLVGAAAVWLLWRPASSAFFKQGFTQALPRHL